MDGIPSPLIARRGNEYAIERHQDAKAVAEALQGVYPMYRFEPMLPKRARLYRIMISAPNGAYLATAKM